MLEYMTIGHHYFCRKWYISAHAMIPLHGGAASQLALSPISQRFNHRLSTNGDGICSAPLRMVQVMHTAGLELSGGSIRLNAGIVGLLLVGTHDIDQ